MPGPTKAGNSIVQEGRLLPQRRQHMLLILGFRCLALILNDLTRFGLGTPPKSRVRTQSTSAELLQTEPRHRRVFPRP